MRAAVYYNNNDIRIETMEKPSIGDNEILVKVIASGICGSDVMEWYRIKKAPLVLGHEIAGEISEVGSKITKYKIGDRVFASHHVPCNTCKYCLQGKHTLCRTLQSTNFFPGGFTEFIRIPAINVSRGVFILPKDISYEEGVFIEPLACAIRGQRIAGVKSGKSVLVIGSGIAGLLHILLAKTYGASNIIAIDINDYRLSIAKKLGADYTFNSDDDIEGKILKINNMSFPDIAIVSTGALSAFSTGFNLVDDGGTVLFFAPAIPGKKMEFDIQKFWKRGVTLTSSYGNSPEDAEEAIDLLRTKRIDVKPMITHRLSLDEAKEGFRLVASADKSIKVILKP